MGRPAGTTKVSLGHIMEQRKKNQELYKQKVKEDNKCKKQENQELVNQLQEKLPFHLTACASSVKIFLKSKEDINLLLSLLK